MPRTVVNSPRALDGNGEGALVDAEERELLARITAQIEHCSRVEHRLARRRNVLRDAATALRLGRGSAVVLAQIQSVGGPSKS